jgi:hypothetical protein
VSLGFGFRGFCLLCGLAVVERARPRFLLFFFFLRFSFFPVFPGSGLYLDLFFFLSGSLFFMWSGGFVW